MGIDVIELAGFYASPLGHVAQRLVGRIIDARWEPFDHMRVIGLGYAPPYLAHMAANCERVLAFMPASQGVVNWPLQGLSTSCLVEPMDMPLPDASVDRVLIVHALEIVENPADLLQEVWRVLAPGGRVMLIVPNRRGLWSRIDTTPFGHGQPFSRTQLRELLRAAMFTPEFWAETLYVPPFNSRLLLRSAVAWERVGISFSLPFAGVHVVEAVKQLYQPLVSLQSKRSSRLSPAFVPAW